MGSPKKNSAELDGVPGAISAHYLWGDLTPLFVGFLEGDTIMDCHVSFFGFLSWTLDNVATECGYVFA